MARRVRRQKKETADIDITSLLDVLVILLVFLLKSYNASDLKVNLVEEVALPSSSSLTLGNFGVVVQINKNKDIWVNDKKIGAMQTNGMTLTNLKDELEKLKKQEKKDNDSRSKFVKMEVKSINLVMDHDLAYTDIKRVMHTAASSGYPKFKFIVQGNY